MAEGNPPSNMTELEVSRSIFEAIFRTSTEYKAQVRPAKNRSKFPKNKEGNSSAVRGSMTASTPNVEIARAITRHADIFSRRIKTANNNTKAGVADVINAPLDAVDNFVPVN